MARKTKLRKVLSIASGKEVYAQDGILNFWSDYIQRILGSTALFAAMLSTFTKLSLWLSIPSILILFPFYLMLLFAAGYQLTRGFVIKDYVSNYGRIDPLDLARHEAHLEARAGNVYLRWEFWVGPAITMLFTLIIILPLLP